MTGISVTESIGRLFFFAASHTLKAHAHVAVDYVHNYVGRRTRYVLEARRREGAGSARPGRIVIAYDTRRNSRPFAEVAASVIAANGLEALLFTGPRATPERA